MKKEGTEYSNDQSKLGAFFAMGKGAGLQLRRNRTGQCQLDGSVTKRYQVPESYLEFLGAVRSCISPPGYGVVSL